MPKPGAANVNATAGMYVYPNDDVAAMYDAVACEHDPTLKCYNQQKWCPADGSSCKADNGGAVFHAAQNSRSFVFHAALTLFHALFIPSKLNAVLDPPP
jgi:hypothetical protein